MKALVSYFKESWVELGKVSWPSHQQTRRLTVAVVIFSLVLGIFIGAVDLGLNEAVKKVLVK